MLSIVWNAAPSQNIRFTWSTEFFASFQKLNLSTYEPFCNEPFFLIIRLKSIQICALITSIHCAWDSEASNKIDRTSFMLIASADLFFSNFSSLYSCDVKSSRLEPFSVNISTTQGLTSAMNMLNLQMINCHLCSFWTIQFPYCWNAKKNSSFSIIIGELHSMFYCFQQLAYCMFFQWIH